MRQTWRCLGVLALLVAATSCGGTDEAKIEPSVPERSTVVDLGTATPWAITSGFGSIWLQTIDETSGVTEVRDGKVSPLIPVMGEQAPAIAVGAGSVWSAFTTRPLQSDYETPEGQAKLARIDPATKSISATIDLGEGSAFDVVANEDRVWVAVEIHDGPGRVVEIDAASNRVVREISLGTGATALALGGSALWAGTGPAEGGGYRLVCIDPANGRTTGSIEVDGRIHALAALDSSVWVATGSPSGADSAVTNVDPVSLKTRFTIDLDGQFGGVLGIADGSVWVGVNKTVDGDFPDSVASVVRIDDATGAVEQILALGDGITRGVLVRDSQLLAMVFESVAEGLPTGQLQIIDP